MNKHVISVDMGGTNIRVGVVNQYGEVKKKRSMLTNAHLGKESVVERLIALIQDMHKSCIQEYEIIGLSLAVPGPYDVNSGVFYNPPNLPGWDRFHFRDIIEKHLNIPIYIINDANAAVLGEYIYGAGADNKIRHLVYLTLGTGVGSGAIINGELLLGSRGFAPEFGHMTIDKNGPVCNCGNVGCLEALVSGTAISKLIRGKIGNGDASILNDMCNHKINQINAEMVAEAAENGDRLALSVIKEAGSNLGIGLVNIIHSFDPEIIVFGGGLSASLGMMMPSIKSEISQRVMNNQKDKVKLVVSKIEENVAILGASSVFFDAMKNEKQN
tara:strand:+ start:56 stop:1039 length:984 start_codon:yes stop_codon:yes gene_type:complete